MHRIIRLFLVIIACLFVNVPSYSNINMPSSPAMSLFRACKDAGIGVRDGVDPLLLAGWKDVTSDSNWRQVVLERVHMEVRARLSKLNYPKRWDDPSLRIPFPTTMARNMDDVVTLSRHKLEAITQSLPSQSVFVLTSPSGRALAAILHHPKVLICEIVEQSKDDPELREKFYSEYRWARQKGAGANLRFDIEGHRVGILMLSADALQPDDRFPVNFDMSIWMRFEKGQAND